MNELELFDFTDLTVPGVPTETGVYASGPFVVALGDGDFIGLMLAAEDSGVSFLDTRRDSIQFADDIAVDKKKLVLKAENDTYTISELNESAVKRHMPAYSDVSLLEARSLYLRRAFPDEIILAVPEFAVTVSADESVVAMFMKDQAGNLHRRESGTWAPITDSSDDPELEDLIWTPVRSSAIEVFDRLSDQDTISVNNFQEYLA